ncbi:calcium-binding protein [uncultured Roseovarius sp.]|uniref:calcium-binding protein n=1 Tax=uncultured Roseovarius sp. TaxID=293344 RepID=UPI00261B2CE5|nr:calcium-binding protein [uncultured Roseovarius sp.]
MNLFSLSGFAVRRDGSPEDNVVEVRDTTFELAIENDVFNYSVTGFSAPDEILPNIELNNDADLNRAVLDGIDITDPSNDGEVLLGSVTTPQGTHVILVVFDEATNTDFIFPIGGDPLNQPSTIAQWEALDASILGGGQVTSGPFAPNQNIALTTFDNTTVSVLPDGELFEGTDGDNQLIGGDGDDTLLGLDGNDNLNGGPGDDLINPGDNVGGFLGFDGITGSTGNDTIDFSDIAIGFVGLNYSGFDQGIEVTIDGSANTGSIRDTGSGDVDTLIDVENPLFSGWTTGGLNITGGIGDDVFDVRPSGAQWMSIRGGDGVDTYIINGDTPERADGSDEVGAVRIDLSGGGAVDVNLETGVISNDGFGNAESIQGDAPVWELRSDDGNDRMVGTSNAESFRTHGGNDTIDGGGGFDRIRYEGDTDSAIVANLATGVITSSAGGVAFTDTVSGIEYVRGTEFDDAIVGNADDNLLQGRLGDDTIEGGLGDDTIEGDGGGSSDSLQSGDGVDTAILNVARADAVTSRNGDDIQIVSAEGTDIFRDVERFQFSDGTVSASDLFEGETILGDDGPDTLEGTLGDDVIASGDGDDSIDGGDGDDTIAASDGDDVVDGGDGNDSIGGGLGDDTLDAGPGNDILGGGQGNDNATGNSGNDALSGGPGGDFLFGGEGNDTIGGSFGNDTIFGEAGDDSLGGGTGQDNINGDAGHDSVGGGEGDDSILGGEGNDFLAGGGRNDRIDGGTGDDTINGGDGDDLMTGGAGADVFVFNFFKEQDEDVITDYEDGVDSFLIRTVNIDTEEVNITNGGNGLQGFVDALGITDTALGAQMNIDGHLVLIEGVAAADLTVDDFQFI